jgi:hypothetical protein
MSFAIRCADQGEYIQASGSQNWRKDRRAMRAASAGWLAAQASASRPSRSEYATSPSALTSAKACGLTVGWMALWRSMKARRGFSGATAPG